jgi:very-short-patch-repair endonuclease
MSYTNQTDHRLLDRQTIREFLMKLSQSRVEASPATHPRAEHLASLQRQCHSDLERRGLAFLDRQGLRLPSHAQVYIEACDTRPDFLYEEHHTTIYIDGPHHEHATQQQRDATQTEHLEDLGYTVIRFSYDDAWEEIVAQHPNIFGRIT